MTEQDLNKLAHLVADWMDAKEDEEKERNHRVNIEKRIAELVPGPEKGQKTVTLGDLKLVVKRDLIYKAEVDAIRDAMASDPKAEKLPPPIKSKTTHELDVTGYEWLHKNHPDIFALLAEHVEVKPAKVNISVKPAKKSPAQ